MKIPCYLKNYEKLYQTNPREANLKWFKDAKYGLFLHYGLYSLLERHEWVQLREKIYVNEYADLKDKFTAERFDADYIAAFARDCGMKYINITTRHHECFCLWDTRETDFNSVNSPAKRDLLAELAEACEKYELGLFFYYTHGRDWRHPHAPNNDTWGGSARPGYDPPEPTYKYGSEHDLDIYLEFMKKQVKELLTMFPTAAGIWFDGIAVPLNGPTEQFKIPQMYEYIRTLSSHALISYKQGVTGTEDFFAPEHRIPGANVDKKILGKIGSRDKLIEMCTTMIDEPVSWGCYKGGKHKTVEQVVKAVEKSVRNGTNLLLNIGPMPDGSLDAHDEKILRKAGKILKEQKII